MGKLKKNLIQRINDSTVGNIVKLVDPTGVTSYYDAGRSLKRFMKNPTSGNFGSLIIDGAAALPIIGGLGKLGKVGKLAANVAKKASIPRNLTKSILNDSSSAYNYYIKTFAPDLYKGRKVNKFRNRNIANKVNDNLAYTSRLVNDGTKIDYNINKGRITKPILYNLGKYSGGNYTVGLMSPVVRRRGNIYNGSYIYNSSNGGNKLSGASKGYIDILKDFIYGHNKRNNYNILPLDTVYVDNSDKQIIDSLRATKSPIYFNTDYMDNDVPLKRKTLIDAKRASGKIIGNNLIINDIWDLKNTTGLFGNKFEDIVNLDKNAGAIPMEQKIPIKYIRDKYLISLTNRILNSSSNLNLGQRMNYKNGGTIHINPANRGKFNATKRRTGKTTEELTHSKNPKTRKRAIFAQNAAKWRKRS